jgi:hypothetical protein
MFLFLLSLACSDIAINEVKRPSIIVAPELLDFGHLLSGLQSDTMMITISNGGSADLIVDRLELEGANYLIDTSGFVIPAGGWRQIEVGYTPKTFEHNEGYIDIYLEGDEVASESVWLSGNGDAPVINVMPADHDFGAPLLGCVVTKEILIQNDGNVDLIVTSVDIMASVPAEITIDFGTLSEFPWSIPPAGRVAFFANYVPLDEEPDTTLFDITSSDPKTPFYGAFTEGAAVISNEVIERWIQETKIIVDIIWIVDNSGSMMPFQNLLGLNMADFMTVFLSYSPDFQMAFITTDSPIFVAAPIDGRTHLPIDNAIATIDSIGAAGSGWEKGLQMLEDCMLSSECTNWMRPDAKLIAIFLSDEPDHSNRTPISFINSFDALKPDMFVPFAIIGDPPHGCPAQTGWNTQAGWGYYDVVQHYASQWFSICDGDWGAQLESLAQTISVKTIFELDSADPHEDTVRVWINGQLMESGWSYDESINSVVFEFGEAPEPGDTIEIGYSSWGCGEE